MRFAEHLLNRVVFTAFVFLMLVAGSLAQTDSTSSGTETTTETTATEAAATPEAAPTTANAPKNFKAEIYAGGQPGAMDGNGVRAQFLAPEAFAIADDGTMYVADTQNSTIRKIDPDGTVTTIAGEVGDAASIEGSFGQNRIGYPTGIDVDSAGNLYISDRGSDQIFRLAPDGQLKVIAGSGSQAFDDGPSREASFYEPEGVVVMGEEVWIADKENNVIRALTPNENDYNVITLAGAQNGGSGDSDGRGADALFYKPIGLSPDGKGNVLVADYANQGVRIMTINGDVTTVAKDLGSLVTDVVMDSQGRYYVALYAYNDIAVLAPDGSILAQLNDFNISVNGPQDLEFGPDGALYVLNEGGNSVVKITIED